MDSNGITLRPESMEAKANILAHCVADVKFRYIFFAPPSDSTGNFQFFFPLPQPYFLLSCHGEITPRESNTILSSFNCECCDAKNCRTLQLPVSPCRANTPCFSTAVGSLPPLSRLEIRLEVACRLTSDERESRFVFSEEFLSPGLSFVLQGAIRSSEPGIDAHCPSHAFTMVFRRDNPSEIHFEYKARVPSLPPTNIAKLNKVR